MWAVFVPIVLWRVRGVVGSSRPGAQKVAASFALAVLLAVTHSVIEMWLHRTLGLHSVLHAGFFSFHFFHGLLTYSVVFAAAAGVESERAGRARERREVQLQNQASQAQLQMLRMQIQPHFLFNTLNSISALVEEDVRGGQKMIGQLSEFLRLTLTHADHRMVPLSEDLPLLDTYVDIQRARFGDRLHVEYEVADEARAALVPNLLLQPLVENAVKHGAQPSLSGGTVWVRAWREQHEPGGKLRFVPVQDVDWIEADGDYVRVHTARTSHLLRSTLSAVEAQVDPAEFVRIHRSTIVRIARIREMEAYVRGEYIVVLESGAKLKLSRN